VQQVLHQLHNNDLWLTGDRYIFWQQQNAIIISDAHFGKTGHFRKHGIGVPQNLFKEDMQRLVNAIAHFNPEQLIVVGDLFHSHANKELELFTKWRKDFPQLKIHLAKGNHDILKAEWYRSNEIVIHEEEFLLDGFRFIHDPTDEQLQNDGYVFSGHIHPGVILKTGSKQSSSFPCFYFGQKLAVLPAFGRFTGTVGIEVKKSETVYAIVNNAIMKV
jgi:DNA ligase-associated metallophosphoesterase